MLLQIEGGSHMSTEMELRILLKECLDLMECEVAKCPHNEHFIDDWDRHGRRCTCSHNCYERVVALVPRLRTALEPTDKPTLEHLITDPYLRKRRIADKS
jgi:hypothetical protein